MMENGTRVFVPLNGITGTIVKQYTPTASEQQTMIRTDDGRLYHAPTRLFATLDGRQLK